MTDSWHEAACFLHGLSANFFELRVLCFAVGRMKRTHRQCHVWCAVLTCRTLVQCFVVIGGEL